MNGNWTWHTVGIYAQLSLGDIVTDFWTLKIKNANQSREEMAKHLALCFFIYVEKLSFKMDSFKSTSRRQIFICQTQV